MGHVTDWAGLWRAIVEEAEGRRPGQPDLWADRVDAYDAFVRSRRDEPDPCRDHVAGLVDADRTVLDVGAGTGAWTLPLAGLARHVTAVEPSPAMADRLAANVAEAGLDNVTIVRGAWPEPAVRAVVGVHDVTVCAHAVYGVADLAGFVAALEAHTRGTCALVLREPEPDNPLSLASMLLRGHRHDGPSFALAYNMLLDLGRRPEVRFGPVGSAQPLGDADIEERLAEVRRRFGLPDATEHDAELRALLERTRREPSLGADCRNRAALITWEVAPAEPQQQTRSEP